MKEGRITQALKTMTKHDVMINKRNHQVMSFGNNNEYQIKIATSKSDIEQAYRLTYQAYLEKGYVKKNSLEMWIPQGLKMDDSKILVVVKDNIVMGTLTAVFDSDGLLPADNIFGRDLNKIRNNGQQLAEITSLSLLPNLKDSSVIINYLINTLFILCHQIKKIDSLVITVNPRHTAFYIKKVLFKKLNNCHAYHKVRGAPAVLLSLDFKEYTKSINGHRNNLKPDRTIFKSFVDEKKEPLIKKILLKQLNQKINQLF